MYLKVETTQGEFGRNTPYFDTMFYRITSMGLYKKIDKS